MLARSDAAEMRQRDNETNRAMTAHLERPDVVEKDDAGDARLVRGRPTSAELRGSFTTAERNWSCCSQKIFNCSATVPPPKVRPAADDNPVSAHRRYGNQ